MKINKGIRFIRQIGDGIYNFIDNYNNDKLYLVNFEDVESEYKRVKNLYRKNSELFDLEDFASNFTFSFYQKKGILDFQKDADLMTKEIIEYLKSK